MNPRYDLPAPWSTRVTAPRSALTSRSRGSMNWNRWYTCLSLRRLSWFSLPSRVRMWSSFRSSTDWPGRTSSGSAAGAWLVCLACFIDPCCLNGFQYALAAARAVVVETIEFDDPVVQVDEAHGGGVDLRVLLDQGLGDAGDVGPLHGSPPAQWFFSAAWLMVY